MSDPHVEESHVHVTEADGFAFSFDVHRSGLTSFRPSLTTFRSERRMCPTEHRLRTLGQHDNQLCAVFFTCLRSIGE